MKDLEQLEYMDIPFTQLQIVSHETEEKSLTYEEIQDIIVQLEEPLKGSLEQVED